MDTDIVNAAFELTILICAPVTKEQRVACVWVVVDGARLCGRVNLFTVTVYSRNCIRPIRREDGCIEYPEFVIVGLIIGVSRRAGVGNDDAARAGDNEGDLVAFALATEPSDEQLSPRGDPRIFVARLADNPVIVV